MFLSSLRFKIFLWGLVVLLVVCVVLAVWLFPLKQNETNSEAMSVAVSQVELDEVAGIYPSFDGEEVFEVVGTAYGALLVTEDGVVSVAGEQEPLTGVEGWGEQWRYLAGKSLTGVKVLSGGEVVALTYGQVGGFGYSLVLLNTETGRLRVTTRLGGRFDPEDEIYLVSSALLRRSGSEMTFYSLVGDDQVGLLTGEVSRTVSDDGFCFGTAVGEAQVTESFNGFVVSVRCTGERGDSHVATHLDHRGKEVWRLEWADVAPGSPHPQVHDISAAVPVGSPQDVLPDLLAKDSTSTYALASYIFTGEDNAYSRSYLFAVWEDAEEHLSPPLMDIEEYPDVLLVGHGGHISEYLTFQAVMTLMDDPDSAVACGDSLFRCSADGEKRYPNTHRAYNQNSNFELQLSQKIEADLS